MALQQAMSLSKQSAVTTTVASADGHVGIHITSMQHMQSDHVHSVCMCKVHWLVHVLHLIWNYAQFKQIF